MKLTGILAAVIVGVSVFYLGLPVRVRNFITVLAVACTIALAVTPFIILCCATDPCDYWDNYLMRLLAGCCTSDCSGAR